MRYKDNGSQSSYVDNLKAIFEQVSKPFLIQNTDRTFLAKLYATMGYTVGAEIGVGGGTFSDLICQHNPGVKLYGIDAWEPYEGYIDFTDIEYLEKDHAKARQTLAPYDVTLIKAYSMDAVRAFEDGSLDFVYIDANHDFVHVTQDIDAWARKVRPGGIVAGHDYLRTRGGKYICHVKDVVQAWAYSHTISPWFVTTREKCPSWFWVVSG